MVLEYWLCMFEKKQVMKYIQIIAFLFLANPLFAQKIYDVDENIRNNSVVITQTARGMISDRNYQKASELLETVMEKDPSFHAAYVNYYSATRNIPSKTGNLIRILKESLSIFEEDDELAYYLGNVFQAENRYPEAIKAYSEAIAFSKINGEDFPIVWAYYFNRANCLLKTNQHAKAIPDYTYSLKLSPDNPDIYTNRGFCYYKTDKRAAACDDWNKAIQFGNPASEKYLKSFCK
ncbi:Tetratricopeptide repeat-containing protein [Rhodonellum ikkaensis]|nr:Tetratricopeptide repeat-containing protein [Rhodonellum ikkaensis]